MRMLGPNGNPSLLNLGSIVRALNKHVGVRVTARAEIADVTASQVVGQFELP